MQTVTIEDFHLWARGPTFTRYSTYESGASRVDISLSTITITHRVSDVHESWNIDGVTVVDEGGEVAHQSVIKHIFRKPFIPAELQLTGTAQVDQVVRSVSLR